MKAEYERELRRLTPRQHRIVMGGLVKKLNHHVKTGILSYAYDVCPVCKDVGSTLEDPKCGDCYIHWSCQAPFIDGFRENPIEGARYFRKMRKFLEARRPPKTIIVGGTWDEDGGRPSKVVEMLGKELGADWILNGGTIENLENVANTSFEGYSLIIWMPSVSNGETKVYPKKGTGAVLVCSKVMREGYTRSDSVSRIFAMHANAVIEIHREEGGWFTFGLRDAMANWWGGGLDTSLVSLARGIVDLYHWTKESIRFGSDRVDKRDEDVRRLMELTSKVADRVENSIGERYFGNVSTRCQRMFPGARAGASFLISPRNTDKRRLDVEDMVSVTAFQDVAGEGSVRYWGPRKPSVDTPVQLFLFGACPKVNYFIHGHARVKGAPTTENYFPCGDLREAYEVEGLIKEGMIDGTCGAINLKNHGFLLYAEDIDSMGLVVGHMEIEEPN